MVNEPDPKNSPNLPLRTDLDLRREFIRNRSGTDLSKLAEYDGEYVAWNIDGSRIIAHSTSDINLYDLVEKAGVKLSECIVERISSEDEI